MDDFGRAILRWISWLAVPCAILLVFLALGGGDVPLWEAIAIILVAYPATWLVVFMLALTAGYVIGLVHYFFLE